MRREMDEENFIVTIRNKNGDEVTLTSPHEKFDMIISNSGHERILHNCLVTMVRANEYFDCPGKTPSTPIYSFDVWPGYYSDIFDDSNIDDNNETNVIGEIEDLTKEVSTLYEKQAKQIIYEATASDIESLVLPLGRL